MTQTAPILVIGATGKTGRRVAERLVARGHAVRAVSRRSDPPFDWDHPETWPEVLRGVRAAYVSYVPDLAVPGAPEAIQKLTELAREAGVERLVLLSGRGEANAERSEDIVRESGLGYTLVRASWFNQNFDEGQLLPSVLGGMVAMPAGDVREPFVDVNDIADVAVAALTEDGHDGQLYEVTGPRLLSFRDAAAEISKASGRDVGYAPVTLDDFHAHLLADAGPEIATLMTELCREVLDGRNQSLGDGVRRALGREPRDFAQFARQAAATGVWSAPVPSTEVSA